MSYKDLRKELSKKYKTDLLSKKILILCERQIYKDLLTEQRKCAKCHRTENLTLDHIVPKSILSTLGIDTDRELVEDNYQILCKPCNVFKSQRLDFSNPKTKEILLRLIEKM